MIPSFPTHYQPASSFVPLTLATSSVGRPNTQGEWELVNAPYGDFCYESRKPLPRTSQSIDSTPGSSSSQPKIVTPPEQVPNSPRSDLLLNALENTFGGVLYSGASSLVGTGMGQGQGSTAHNVDNLFTSRPLPVRIEKRAPAPKPKKAGGRTRTVQACHACRCRKHKCSGSRAGEKCGRCEKKGLVCLYTPTEEKLAKGK